ncbi:MAG TPA: PQQ-binding-like beta-propeller repeat protein [Candidatus Dormibacteraeota bacterium]
MKRLAIVALLAGVLAWPLAARVAAKPGCESSWTMYGHDLAHSFQQPCTDISPADVAGLLPRWHVHTADSVTASPAVADGVLYDGDWSGNVYAIAAATGQVLWTRNLDDGENVAFGRISSSPTLANIGGRRVLLIAGGATLYALQPSSGAVLASISLDPRSGAELTNGAPVEVESSPTVGSGGVIYVGLDVNETAGSGRTGLVALALTTSGFQPLWKFDPELGRVYTGAGLLKADPSPATDFGCGDVWSSPAIDAASGLVLFATANCANSAEAKASGQLWSEAMFAVSAGSGAPAWKFQPAAVGQSDPNADDDFGASPNLITTASGRHLDGEGQKSAVYFALDRTTGAEVWHQLAGQPGNVQAGNAIGGFIGSSAVESSSRGTAQRIIGATALPFPDPSDPASIDRMTWAVRALDPETGRLLWVDRLAAPCYGATSVAGGVAFVPDTFSDTVEALDATTGTPLWAFPLDGPPSSTPVVVGDALYLGTGTGEQGPNGQNVLAGASGIWAFGL